MATYKRDVTTYTNWAGNTGSKKIYRVQQGIGQRPIAGTPLAYNVHHWIGARHKVVVPGNGAYKSVPEPSLTFNYYPGGNLPMLAPVMNRAVARFKEGLGDSAALGAALATVPESFAMIAGRAGSMLKAYRHLKRGQFKKFAKALNTRPLPKHKKTKWTAPKNASALWLEYWFGWVPMIGDIFSALHVVNNPFAPVKILGTASEPTMRVQTINRWGGKYTEWFFGKHIAKVQADVTVVNPNLYLLQKLGLLNPASIAWELTPWSFMVDWFGNIGDVIDEWTAYAGLKFSNAFSTRAVKGNVLCEGAYKSGGVAEKYETTYKFIRQRRTLGVAATQLYFEIPGGVSKTRAATAVSLLTLLFKKG